MYFLLLLGWGGGGGGGRGDTSKSVKVASSKLPPAPPLGTALEEMSL